MAFRGVIITNAHVAKGRTHSVEFGVGRHMLARTVARDAALHLAALAVSDLPPAFARSAREVRSGGLVIAIGNPRHGDSAVSAEIVHRPSAGSSCIFANHRIVPGNSDGPLADANGCVIGINCAIIGGLASAMPSDAEREFLRKAVLEAA